jgi:transcriptional regulator with XRE-family HTH domain
MNDAKRGSNVPYQQLGSRLKRVRERASETLLEASGAVEIDPKELERIEDGQVRPSEDILMLLINHFDVQDTEAVQLWELAGYEGNEQHNSQQIPFEKTVVLLAMDVRTIYSDGLNIDVNQNGLVMNFTQAGTTPDQRTPVARVGMSYQQATQVYRALQHALLYAEGQPPKLLPPTNHEQDIS